MQHAPTIDEIVDHLRALVSKDKGGKCSPLREAFERLAGSRKFTNAQMRAVFKHASETGRTELNGSLSQMWLFFQDGLSKTTMSYDRGAQARDKGALVDMIVLSRWNAENFPKLMGYDTPRDIPAYPAAITMFSDFRIVPAYIEKSVMPLLRIALESHINTDASSLENIVREREQDMLRNGVPGYEAVTPLRNWPIEKKEMIRKGEIQQPKSL